MKENGWETAVCPECGQAVKLSARINQYHLLLCPKCETLLVVTAVSPFRLDWAFEEPLPPHTPYNPNHPHHPHIH